MTAASLRTQAALDYLKQHAAAIEDAVGEAVYEVCVMGDDDMGDYPVRAVASSMLKRDIADRKGIYKLRQMLHVGGWPNRTTCCGTL